MALSKKAAALLEKAGEHKKPDWSDSLPAEGKAVLYEIADAYIAGTLGRSWASLHAAFCDSYGLNIAATTWNSFVRRYGRRQDAKQKRK